MAALLALAVVLFWPPNDPGSASPYNQGAHLAHQSHNAHAVQDTQDQAPHVNRVADCEASAIGCCVMTLCHPGISVGPHDMPDVAADDDTIPASAVQGLGSGPGIILPPPRHLLV